MLNNIYNKRILQLASDIPFHDRLDKPQATASAHAKICGSKITVDLTLAGGRVAKFGQEVKACALGQASASLLASLIIGSTPDELRDLQKNMHRMLEENGPPPQGKWQEFEVFTPVRVFPARHASTLLVFDAVTLALDKIAEQERLVP